MLQPSPNLMIKIIAKGKNTFLWQENALALGIVKRFTKEF